MTTTHTKKDIALNVWVLSDDKPGHANQTLGLTKALSNYRQITISKQGLLTFSELIKMWLLKWCDKNIDNNLPDLIISTGHHTHLSLIAYKKCYGGKTVVMMTPTLPSRFFDLCFIPRHDNPRRDSNIIETLGAINKVIPSELSQEKNTGLILLGGPSKHFKWDSKYVVKQIQKLVQRQPNIKWEVAGSRRTPLETYDEVNAIFSELKPTLPDSVSSDWLAQKMLRCEYIWVTADSVSMIYEALTSGAKTGVLELGFDKPSRITKEMDRLQNEGVIMSIKELERTPTTTSFYEADRCAKLLLEKFRL